MTDFKYITSLLSHILGEEKRKIIEKMPSEFSFNEQKWKKNMPSIDSDETRKK